MKMISVYDYKSVNAACGVKNKTILTNIAPCNFGTYPKIAYPNIPYPNIFYPNLTYHNLTNANLTYPNLTYPNLTKYK